MLILQHSIDWGAFMRAAGARSRIALKLVLYKLDKWGIRSRERLLLKGILCSYFRLVIGASLIQHLTHRFSCLLLEAVESGLSWLCTISHGPHLLQLHHDSTHHSLLKRKIHQITTRTASILPILAKSLIEGIKLQLNLAMALAQQYG